MTLVPAQIDFDENGRLVSTAYGDIYFQPEQGRAESDYVFLQQGGFYEALEKDGDIHVGELGFGTGLNFLLCCEAFAQKKSGWLHFTSFEKHPVLKDGLEKIYRYWPELAPFSETLLHRYPLLTEGIHKLVFEQARITLTLVLGDVAKFLPNMNFGNGVDIWFLDGFAPAKNPGMWAERLWHPLARATKPGGRITTFTAAGAVRRGLADAGFAMEKTRGFGRKRDMLTGRLENPPPAPDFDARSFPVPPAPDFNTVTIVGAGIAGCALAEALTRYGHQVVLIDRHQEPASEASGNPQAAVYPKLNAADSPADRMYRQAFAYTQNFYHHLPGSTFSPCGVFQIDRNDEVRKRHQKIAARGLPKDLAEYLETDTVTGLDLESGGLFLPSGGTVCPPVLCRALLDKAAQTGLLKTEFGVEVSDIQDLPGLVVLADGVSLTAPQPTAWLPTEIVRGQVTEWTGTDKSRTLKTVICHKGYMTPAQGGTHIIGATFDKGAAKTAEPTAANHRRNLEQLYNELPLLKPSPSHAARGTLPLPGGEGAEAYAEAGEGQQDPKGRVGNRVATPDRLPLFGAVPDIGKFNREFAALTQDASTRFETPPVYHDGLYIVGALGSHGMTTAPWLAECLAAQLSGQPLPMPRGLYNRLSPVRFATRSLIRQTPKA